MDNTAGGKPPTLEALLQAARHRIEVDDAELKEARDRRDLIGAALRREFPGSRTYVNGSIAHGDALTPLTDVDLGVVVFGAERTHGPGKRGPQDLEEQAAEAIRRELKGEFPKLVVTVKGRKRAVLVRFGDPVTPGQPDFTSDVIVALDVPGERGLWIPCGDSWDRSDPEGHTKMVRAANRSSDAAYAQVVRLLKHWNRMNQKPLCSWNIKALALGCLIRRVSMLEGLRVWFDYAYKELSRRGETPDPAGVAPEPIHLNESMDVCSDVSARPPTTFARRSASKTRGTAPSLTSTLRCSSTTRTCCLRRCPMRSSWRLRRSCPLTTPRAPRASSVPSCLWPAADLRLAGTPSHGRRDVPPDRPGAGEAGMHRPAVGTSQPQGRREARHLVRLVGQLAGAPRARVGPATPWGR